MRPQDVLKKRRTEVDHLNGFISRKGREAGVPTPFCDKICEVVHSLGVGLLLYWWEPEPLPQLGLKATMMAFGAEEWLLDRYGEGIPAKAAGWLCDQLDPH